MIIGHRKELQNGSHYDEGVTPKTQLIMSNYIVILFQRLSLLFFML